MTLRLTNASQSAKIYYGLHMYPGVAEYTEKGKEPLRVFIGEEAIKRMNSTFPGKPVYVNHVPEVNLENIQQEADGWVSDSFFNKSDGKNWVKFVVVSDRGHEAVAKGWKLSNAYFAKERAGGGLCNGVEYQQEVTKGEYEHLAIVPNPRYEESVILTPEQFKTYNEKKEIELMKLANSKEPQGDNEMSFFKKTKLENASDFESTMTTLPNSGKDVTVKEACALADKYLNMQGYAGDDHMVKCNDDEEMSVGDLKKTYNKMKNAEKDRLEKEEEAKKNAALEGKKEGEAGASDADKKAAEKKENDLKLANALKAKEAALAAASDAEKFFNELNGAEGAAKPIKNESDVEMSQTKVERGRSRYGSSV